jgi:hypothetical protein
MNSLISGTSIDEGNNVSRSAIIKQRAAKITYYNLSRKWHKIKPHLDDPRVVDTLVRDFHKFTFGRWKQHFTAGQYPREFETCLWDIDHRGRPPQWWKYVKHAASHWLVNFSLELAQLVEPTRKWRIITSDEYSTVWDGECTLFDFNFCAFGISPQECFESAYQKELKPGKHLKVYFAEHYTHDLKRANGIEPTSGSSLRIHKQTFGYKYVFRSNQEVKLEAERFIELLGLADWDGERAFELARAIVLYYASGFAAHGAFLSPPDDTDKTTAEITCWKDAVSFLIAHDIDNIDEDDETDCFIVPDEIVEFATEQNHNDLVREIALHYGRDGGPLRNITKARIH